MAPTPSGTANGVDVQRLVGTINTIKENPELADFRFRAHTVWTGGAKSETRIQGFFGPGQEDTSRAAPFVLKGDEPSVLLGEDTAVNAVEAVLQALASCLTVGVAHNAAARGIHIRKLSFDLEGDLNLLAFLGLSDERRAGYEGFG